MNTSTPFSSGKLIPIVIAVALVVGGGSFYGGMKYAESKSSSGDFSARGARLPDGQGSAFGGQNLQNLSPEERQQMLQEHGANAGGFRNRTGGQQGGGSASGEIIAKDDKSVTIKLRDGGSKIFFFADSTEIAKSVSGTPNDLEIGKSVVINGKANQDGSITAESIQLRSNPQ